MYKRSFCLNKKILSISLLFFIIMSNLSFSLTNVFSFISEKNNCVISNTVNIQEQYNMLVNMPKNFISICVKVGYDIKTFANFKDKSQMIFAKSYKFDQTPTALIYSVIKLKALKSINNYKKLLFNFIKISLKMLIIPIIIFYLLCYIGLLRLFGSMNTLLPKVSSRGNSVYVMS